MASKTELKDALIRTNQLDGRNRSPEWMAAFDGFNSDPANKHHKVTPGCPSCWNQVRHWLKS